VNGIDWQVTLNKVVDLQSMLTFTLPIFITIHQSKNIMQIKKLFASLLLLPGAIALGQEVKAPLVQNNFARPTNYDELSTYVKQLDALSPKLEVEVVGQSVENRNIYALKYSSTQFGKDPKKLKVLIFAQQHGNEQSGKDGALLLAGELLKPENQYLLEYIDFALIPQVNPDGSEANKRRNGHSADLNRNHLILEEPEVIALHQFFDKYQFDVNMDVHEYAPYGETWKAYGYRCNSDELIGVNTNINISKEIRDFANSSFVPFYRNYLTDNKFSNSIYAPGGPPEIEYIRHSTFDINDGRQSFGILNSFSLIQEGLNGFDTYKDNIEHRAKGQAAGMRALLEFAAKNHETIKTMVGEQRANLLKGEPQTVSIQMEHVRNGKEHPLPVYSYSTGKDSIIMVKDYRPVIQSITDVAKPEGYLIPKSNMLLTDWAKRHQLTTSTYKPSKKLKIEQYEVAAIDSMDFEGDMIVNPQVKASELAAVINANDYVYIPTTQLKGNMVVIALEPKSELGLVTYKNYNGLLKAGEKYPVLRVVKANPSKK
jgi:hypothetical protein